MRRSKKRAPTVAIDIGVVACDEYILKMSGGTTKMAPAAAGSMTESIATLRKAWKEAAATPEGRTAVASACEKALGAARTDYASLGCAL